MEQAIGVGLIAPEHLAEVWPRVAVWIRQANNACPSVCASLEAIRRRIARKRYALLVAAIGNELRGAVLLEHLTIRDERILAVHAAGGERGNLELLGPVLWEAVHRIGRGLGVDVIRVRGRPAWLRWLTGTGRLREVLIDYRVRE